MDYVISRRIEGGDVFFTVRWSPIAKADKYDIVRSVPAIGGIAELYFKDRRDKLNLFCLQRSWYGGLRSMIRERCDPVLEKDAYRGGILEKWEGRTYYRWTNSESATDMADVMYFFMETYAPGEAVVESSGRFHRIFVKEIDAEKLTTI